MNNKIQFRPAAYYGTLIALVLLALVLEFLNYSSATPYTFAMMADGTFKVAWAAGLRLLFLFPIYFCLIYAVAKLLGTTFNAVRAQVVDHTDDNDSVILLVIYLTVAFAFVMVTTALAPTFFVNFINKGVIMLGFGIALATLMNLPFYGLNGRKFAEAIVSGGSDAAAHITGWAFIIAAIFTCIFL